MNVFKVAYKVKRENSEEMVTVNVKITRNNVLKQY